MINHQPVRYDPAYEEPEADEAETIAALLDTMRSTRETTYANSGHAMRSVHVKSHGLLKGELEVLPGLPETLAQGLFAQPGRYAAVMRLSTSPADMLPDRVSTPRGCALKIVGVEGARLSGSESDVTQDFVMVNGEPAFQVANLKRFLALLKPLAAVTDKAEGMKVVVSAAMQGMEKLLESVGGHSGKIKNMGGEPEKHILGETFFTQVPILYGDYMAKMSLAPASPELTALTGQTLDVTEKPFGIREAVMDFFRTNGAVWELRAQLCTDLESMPIEDASVAWPEDASPYVAVARLHVPAQQAWSQDRSTAMEDGMSFSPWHGLATHRPLGAIMRARKAAYEASARFRTERNARSVEEPKTLDALPD